jgi:hypothetical protein
MPYSCLEVVMFSQFEEIMRHHPAGLMGRAGRPESPLSAFQRLERKPFRLSPSAAPQRDRLSFGGGLTLLAALFGIMAAALAL